MYTIETTRLGFVPLTEEATEAALRGEKELANVLGLTVAGGFIEPVHRERVFPIRLEKLKKHPEFAAWYGFITEKKTRTVIGTIGYKTPPGADGLVEIGYGIHPDFHRKGYAFEMAEALKDGAFRQPGVTDITATGILKDNSASIRIAAKLGMTLVQENAKTVDYAVYKV